MTQHVFGIAIDKTGAYYCHAIWYKESLVIGNTHHVNEPTAEAVFNDIHELINPWAKDGYRQMSVYCSKQNMGSRIVERLTDAFSQHPQVRFELKESKVGNPADIPLFLRSELESGNIKVAEGIDVESIKQAFEGIGAGEDGTTPVGDLFALSFVYALAAPLCNRIALLTEERTKANEALAELQGMTQLYQLVNGTGSSHQSELMKLLYSNRVR